MDGRPNIGGMEKAFSKNVMMRLVEFFAGRLIVDMFWEAPPTRKQPRKRKRTCRRLGNGDGGVWDLLPNDLLVSVLMKLSVIDYISFSGVCRSWRSTSIYIRKFFMERQQPLVVVRPRYSKKACVLYNMFDGKSWKAMLPDLPCKNLVGLSCGYLITIDRNTGFWLVNLMTRHELHFPSLPESMGLRKSLVLPESVGGILDFKIRAVLFRSTQLSRVFLVLFSRNHKFILLSESGAIIWQEYLLPNISAGISDVKILDGKIFVLTRDALFGEFNPRAVPVLKLYKIKIPIQPDIYTCLDLVTSDSKLYMIVSQYLPNLRTSIQCPSFYEIDYKLESVQPIHDLGSKSLFLSRYNSAVVDTSGWGAGNCVCVLKSMYLNRCSFFHLNGNELATAPVIWDGYLKPYFWYFPGESWDISSVSDEFGL